MHVSDILNRKGHDIISVAAGDTLETCASKMKLERVGALVVCDAEGILRGIVAERGVVHAVSDYGPRALKMRAEEIMDPAPATCAPTDTVAAAARHMIQRRVRHVPVCENRRIVGIVSIHDIVVERLEEVELERDTLRDMAGAHLAAG